MFLCTCGGVFIVKNIEEYSPVLSSSEKLDYKRLCTVECPECGKIEKNKEYDT